MLLFELPVSNLSIKRYIRFLYDAHSENHSKKHTQKKRSTFSDSFGYRISVIFRVKSAKAVKITDGSLLKRLGVIVMIFSVFLSIRTLVAPPVVIVARTADDLKAYLCRTDWWDHSFTTREYFKRSIQLFETRFLYFFFIYFFIYFFYLLWWNMLVTHGNRFNLLFDGLIGINSAWNYENEF